MYNSFVRSSDKNKRLSPTAPERDLPEPEPLRDRERPLPLPEREPDLDLCAKNKNKWWKDNGDKKHNHFIWNIIMLWSKLYYSGTYLLDGKKQSYSLPNYLNFQNAFQEPQVDLQVDWFKFTFQMPYKSPK